MAVISRNAEKTTNGDREYRKRRKMKSGNIAEKEKCTRQKMHRVASAGTRFIDLWPYRFSLKVVAVILFFIENNEISALFMFIYLINHFIF